MEDHLKGISMYSSDSIRLLEEVVIKRFGISPIELRSRQRIGAKARQVMFYLLNKHFMYSSVMIGRMYNRDHSTVLLGMKWVQNNKKRSAQADELFLHCIKNGEQAVDKLSKNMNISGDSGVDNVGINLPHDEGMKSYPTVSSKYPQNKKR